MEGYRSMKQVQDKYPKLSQPQWADLADTVQRLQRLCEATGMEKEAARWRTELEKVRKTMKEQAAP
jgi:hypothetical protein